MAELPVPVEVPDFKVKSPPAKLAVPAIAPPLEMVKPCPAVAAVVFLSIPKILAAVPPNARIEPGSVVPMPTLPLVALPAPAKIISPLGLRIIGVT